MSEEATYRLLGEIFALVANRNADTFRAAEGYVRASFQGIERQRILDVLTALSALVTQTSEDRDRPPLSLQGAPATVPRVHEQATSEDPVVREFKAILQDATFLPSRSDLAHFVQRYLSKLSVSISGKDSRQALVRKYVEAFEAAPSKLRKSLFTTIRRAYFRNRKSDLTAWSEIIVDTKDSRK